MSIINKVLPFYKSGRIWEYRNHYKGQKCYLIGDGPSVKNFDLSCFSDAPTIATNMMPMHIQFKDLNALAVVLNTPFQFSPKVLRYRNYLRKERLISIGYRDIIKEHLDVDFVFNMTNKLFIQGENINFTGSRANFSDKKLREMEWFTGGFYGVIGLALFLGFEDIFLVGQEGAIGNGMCGHWYEKAGDYSINTNNFFAERYNILQEYANFTMIVPRGGDSNYIHSVSYTDYTGKELSNFENCDILTQAHYALLSTHPNYCM